MMALVRSGRLCTRCGGQVIRTYPDEPATCFQCGDEPLDERQRTFIDYLRNEVPDPGHRQPRMTTPRTTDNLVAHAERPRKRASG